MRQTERMLAELRSRLQADLLALDGKLPVPSRPFEAQLLIPIGMLLGAVLLVSLSPRARKRVFWQAVMLAAAGIDGLRLAEWARKPRVR